MVKILHTSDWHLDAKIGRQAKAERSLEQISEYLSANEIDLVLNTGDLFHQRQSFEGGSGVEIAHKWLKIFGSLCENQVIVKGNNEHDEEGSISLLHQITPNTYAYEYPVLLGRRIEGDLIDLLRADFDLVDLHARQETIKYTIGLMPYPTKAMLVKDASIDNNNKDYADIFDGIMDLFGMINNKFNCPKAFGFHGNVQGSRLSNGQSLLGQDIIISPNSLEKSGADYIGLGHIHNPQQITKNMYYAGSLYNNNFGEVETKSFNVITLGGSETKIEQIQLKAVRPMVTVDADFRNGKLVVEDGKDFLPNAEVRFRFTVKENETALVTEEVINKIKEQYGSDVQIKKSIIPVQRQSRSEEIMHQTTIKDEVLEYAKVINQPMNESIESKISEVQ